VPIQRLFKAKTIILEKKRILAGFFNTRRKNLVRLKNKRAQKVLFVWKGLFN